VYQISYPMADPIASALRAWAKKLKYPELIDLHRLDNFPNKSIHFIQWLTSLSAEHSLISNNMTIDQFEFFLKDSNLEDDNDDNDVDNNESIDSNQSPQIELEEDEESIDHLNKELQLIILTNTKIKKKISCITDKIMKLHSESINEKNTKFDQTKHLIRAEEQDLELKNKSEILLNLSPHTERTISELKCIVNEIVHSESVILRSIATSSSAFDKNKKVDLYSETPAKNKGETNHFDDAEMEENRQAVRRLQESRTKLLEVSCACISKVSIERSFIYI
jgi:hypothetical protein